MIKLILKVEPHISPDSAGLIAGFSVIHLPDVPRLEKYNSNPTRKCFLCEPDRLKKTEEFKIFPNIKYIQH